MGRIGWLSRQGPTAKTVAIAFASVVLAAGLAMMGAGIAQAQERSIVLFCWEEGFTVPCPPGIPAEGTSMQPYILKGDTVFLAPFPSRVVRIGHVIAYESPVTQALADRDLGRRIVVTHRVIRTGYDDQGWWAVTKGDNEPSEDSWIVRDGTYRGIVALTARWE